MIFRVPQKFLAGLLFQNTKVDQRHGQRFVIKDDILVTVELDLWFLWLWGGSFSMGFQSSPCLFLFPVVLVIVLVIHESMTTGYTMIYCWYTVGILWYTVDILENGLFELFHVTSLRFHLMSPRHQVDRFSHLWMGLGTWMAASMFEIGWWEDSFEHLW